MKKNGAFTLVEMLVAILIFGVSMTFGLSYFILGKDSMERAKNRITASQVAKNYIETLKENAYTLGAYSFPAGTTSVSSTTIVEGITYSYTATMSPLPVSTDLNGVGTIKAVKVRVNWTKGTVTNALDVNTYVARPDQEWGN